MHGRPREERKQKKWKNGEMHDRDRSKKEIKKGERGGGANLSS